MNSKETLLAVYNEWYENNRPKIKSGQWNIIDENLLLHPEQDSLRGLNLIAYLPPQINEIIDNSLLPKIIGMIGKSGWVIPQEGRHLTILDIIPHKSGVEVSAIKDEIVAYQEAVQRAIKKTGKPILVGFEGVFASPDGITIQGFPLNEGLIELRKELREQLALLGLANLEGNKYRIETAHVALIKFVDKLDGEGLLGLVDNLRDFVLGEFQIQEIVLNISSRYDKSQTIEVIEKYNFGG